MISFPARLAAPIAAAFVFLLMMVRVIYFYFSPDSSLIGVIPDDAFYYIQMAKHRAADGLWTFDGASPATGFHFLYGYFLVSLYSIFGDIYWRHLYLLIGILASIFISMAAYLTYRSAEDMFGARAAPIAVAPFISPYALMQSTAMMEAWIVVFMSALTIFVLTNVKKTTTAGAAGLLLLGIMGSLARTDYGMLPGVIFCAHLVGYYWFRADGIKKSSFVLLGAVTGIAVVLLQNLYISGQLFQASAQVKFYWSSISGHSILGPIVMVVLTALPSFGIDKYLKIAVLFGLAAPLFAYALVVSFRAENRKDIRAMTGFLGCLLTIFGYILFYRHNSEGLQHWYSSNFIAPTGIVLASIAYYAFKKKALAASAVAFCVYGYIASANIFLIPHPDQSFDLQEGIFLKEQKTQDIYASWDAGILGYFSGGSLINIDGLANDEVLPYIKSNTLFDYLKKKNVRYLIDYEYMLNNQRLRTLWGFSDTNADKCIRGTLAWKGGFPDIGTAEDRRMVFEIIPGCH